MRTVLLLHVSAGLFFLAPNMLIIITLGVCGVFYVRVCLCVCVSVCMRLLYAKS